jgi:hypothetical protein
MFVFLILHDGHAEKCAAEAITYGASSTKSSLITPAGFRLSLANRLSRLTNFGTSEMIRLTVKSERDYGLLSHVGLQSDGCQKKR